MVTRITPYHCKYKCYDGDEVTEYIGYFDSLGELLHHVSYMYAFDDCDPRSVTYIEANGEELRYVGWQPGMLYEYINSKGEVVWSGFFPEWDH